MEIRICSKCEFNNPGNEWSCLACGSTISVSSLTECEDQNPEKYVLIKALNSSKDVSFQLATISELALWCSQDQDVVKFLRAFAKRTNFPGVRSAAIEATQAYGPVKRALSDLEEFILQQIQDVHGEQYSVEMVIFSGNDFAEIRIDMDQESTPLVLEITSLANKLVDGTIPSTQALRRDWLGVKPPEINPWVKPTSQRAGMILLLSSLFDVGLVILTGGRIFLLGIILPLRLFLAVLLFLTTLGPKKQLWGTHLFRFLFRPLSCWDPFRS